MASVVHGAHRNQEYSKFARFAESLLQRSTKLSDLIGNLHAALEQCGKSEDSLEGKRVTKPMTQIDSDCPSNMPGFPQTPRLL